METLGGIRNPFLHQVVADPWDHLDSDVPSINQKAFDQCIALIDDVKVRAHSTSILMNGEAGSGKTHLMSRVRQHMEQNCDAIFFSIRLETVASRIWRHIRLSIVADLLRTGADGANVLSKILNRRDPARAIGTISYGVATVLDHYHAGRYQSWCIAWLKGEPLPESVLTKLEVAAEEVEEVSAEEGSHQIVLELCRLAAPAVIVFCFDQVEALQTAPGDQEGLLAYGKAITALHAELNNSLLISLIQTSFLPDLQKSHSYMMDRLGLHRVELNQLSREQGTQVLVQRMTGGKDLDELRAAHASDTVWPLTQKQIADLYHTETRCSARKLLHYAAAWFETARGVSMRPDQTVEEYLESEYASRLEASLGNPAGSNTDTIIVAGLQVLLALSGKRGQTDTGQKLIDFVIETPGAPIAVCLVNSTNPGAVARRVRKISEGWNAREFARLRLVRDARLPLSTNAPVTQDALKALRTRGARLIRPSAEAIAALDAIRSIWADAQSGNLAGRGEAVPSAVVLRWLAKRVPVALQELAAELMESGNEDAIFSSGLLEYLQKKSIVKLEDAADAVGASAEEVAAYARSHPSRVGYLAGPPQVLFDPVAARVRPEG